MILKVAIVIFAVFATIAAVLSYEVFSNSDSGKLRGAIADPPRDISQVELVNKGTATRLSAQGTKLRLVYFGYTTCPDVCPTTLSDIRSALDSIGSRANQVNVTLITIDPERDSMELLEPYLERFFPHIRHQALRTDDQTSLIAVTKAFGASYKVTPAANPGGQPEVSHSASVYAVNQSGQIIDQWLFGTPAKDIAHDLKILI